VSRVSRRWTTDERAELESVFQELMERPPSPAARLRWERLIGQRRRAMRVRFGPRKAFRRSL
jgi:hypothetical protein